MPWTDPHWGISLFFLNNGTWRVPTLEQKIHSCPRSKCFDIKTTSNTIERITVSQTQEFTLLPPSWPADHRRVQSPDPVWFPLPGQGGYFTTSCLHFTLEAKESDGDWGEKCLNTTGGCLFLDWSHPAIVGALPKSGTEVHRGRNQVQGCTAQSAPAGQGWWRIMSAKEKQKTLWPLWAWRQPLYTVKHLQQWTQRIMFRPHKHASILFF